MKIRAAFLGLAILAAVGAAEERPLLFNAVMTIGREHRVVLVSPSGRVSEWLRAGEAFEGWKVGGFEAKAGVLTVQRGEQELRLKLVADAATLEAAEESATVTTEAEGVLEGIRFERMVDKLLAQTKEALLRRLAGGATRERAAPPEEMGEVARLRAEAIGAVFRTAEVRAQMERRLRAIFSAAEARELALFYNSPVAQKLAEPPGDVFTTDEAAAIAAFRASPLGRKMAAVEADLALDVNRAASRRLGAMMRGEGEK